MIDFLALKMGLEETSEADAVDAIYQAPECEEALVEPARECRERLAKAGSVAITTSAAQGTSSRSELGGALGQKTCQQARFSVVQDSTTVLLESSATSCIGIAHGRHSWSIDTEWTQTIHQISVTELKGGD